MISRRPESVRSCLVALVGLCLLTAAAGHAAAQDQDAREGEPPAAAPDASPPSAEVVAPVPAVEPTIPAEPALPRYRPDAEIQLNFRDASLDAVLNHLSEIAGLVIVQTGRTDARINVISRQPVTVDEAIDVINSALRVHSLCAVRVGRVLKVIPLAQAGKANMRVSIGADPRRVPETDEVITQVVPLRGVQAPRLVTDLQPLVGTGSTIVANADSNTLVITDTAANVRRLLTVIQAMDDAPVAARDVRVFPLQYARATDAARLINEVFKETAQTTGGRSNVPPWMRSRRGDNEEEDQASPIGTSIPIASADDRTNTLVVSGSTEVLAAVAVVVRELDANPTQTQGVFIYKVNNGQAANIESVLNTLFGTSGTRNADGTVSGGGLVNQNRQASTGSTGAAGSTSGRGGGDSRSRFFEAMRQAAGAQLSAQSLQTAGDLYGQVFTVADDDTNSLLIMTAPSNFEAVRAILVELDRPVRQVLLKVLVAEVTHSDSIDLGLEFSVLNAPNASTLLTDFGLGAATGGLIYKFLSGDFTMTIRALEEVGKLEVLSRPYILASDNQLASITVGSEVPFVTSSQLTESGQTNSTYRYEDVGIILNVTPRIGPDNKVTMDVSPEISALSGETVEVSENLSLPVIEKRSASTRVAIHDGQTIVIGGLMEDRKTSEVDKVPLLGDIPIVGALFRRTQDGKRKTELLIFITPHIAASADDLQPMSEDELRGVQIVPEAVEKGMYDKHLEGMERGRNPNSPTPDPTPPTSQPITVP